MCAHVFSMIWCGFALLCSLCLIAPLSKPSLLHLESTGWLALAAWLCSALLCLALATSSLFWQIPTNHLSFCLVFFLGIHFHYFAVQGNNWECKSLTMPQKFCTTEQACGRLIGAVHQIHDKHLEDKLRANPQKICAL